MLAFWQTRNAISVPATLVDPSAAFIQRRREVNSVDMDMDSGADTV